MLSNIESYTPRPWHKVLVECGVLAVCLVFVLSFGNRMRIVELIVFIAVALGFMAASFPLMTSMEKHQTLKDIFNTFVDETNWPSTGLSFLVGSSNWALITLGESWHLFQHNKSQLMFI